MEKKNAIIKEFNLSEDAKESTFTIFKMRDMEKMIDVFTSALITQLVKRFRDAKEWQILGLVECEIKRNDSNSDNEIYAVEKKANKLQKDRKYFKQDFDMSAEDSIFPSEYIWQINGATETSYYGTILLPMHSNLFLKISYSF
jgi:hypothetical protein